MTDQVKARLLKAIQRYTLLLTICWLQLCSGVGGTEPGAAELLKAGSFHSDEVSAKSGQVWYALYRRPTRCELKASKIRVKTVKDPIVDYDTTESTGKEVLLDRPGKTLFLVRGLAGLKDRPVACAYVGDPTRSLRPGQVIVMKLGGKKYKLSVLGKSRDNSLSGALLEYKLILSDGVRSQTIAAHVDCNDAHPHLVWAGDLDGDGRLDLLVDSSSHYNVFSRTLWVSTGTTTTQIVRPAAKFETSGC